MSSKKFCFWLALICLFVCVFTLPKLLPVPGVSPNVQAVAQPRVIMEVLDPSLEQFSTMWRDEIGRRFDNAVGVLCHGGDFVPGEWVAGTSDQPWAHVSKNCGHGGMFAYVWLHVQCSESWLDGRPARRK
jgi:hypothetical protein